VRKIFSETLPGHKPFWQEGLGLLLKATGITLLGVLLVVGTGSTEQTLLAIREFRGIKLALGLPFILMAILLYKKDPLLLKRLKNPITLGQLLGILGGAAVLGAAAFVLLARSGNNPVFAGSSGLEDKLRLILEKLLVARPRTKEFLVGYPLFWLALSWVKDKWLVKDHWFYSLLVLGALVCQVSLINTFCHFHTPLWFSLLRCFHGLWVGTLVGLGLVWVLSILRRKGLLG
jgi:hypothetical protein